jgi:hypothetical protein
VQRLQATQGCRHATVIRCCVHVNAPHDTSRSSVRGSCCRHRRSPPLLPNPFPLQTSNDTARNLESAFCRR